MYYQVTIAIPANTPEAAPVITPLTLTKGVIATLRVGFPPGCAGLAHVVIREKGWQIVPWSLDESLHWDGYVFEFKPQYPMSSDPYDLTIHAWNLDDSYEHTVFVGAEVVGEELSLLAWSEGSLYIGKGDSWLTK